MKTDIAKLFAYPAFVLLGPLIVDHYVGGSPYLAFAGIVVYFMVVVLMARDPALLRVPYNFRSLGVGLVLALAILFHGLNVFNLGQSWLPITAINTATLVVIRNDPEHRVRVARAWSRLRNSTRWAR